MAEELFLKVRWEDQTDAAAGAEGHFRIFKDLPEGKRLDARVGQRIGDVAGTVPPCLRGFQ